MTSRNIHLSLNTVMGSTDGINQNLDLFFEEILKI